MCSGLQLISDLLKFIFYFNMSEYLNICSQILSVFSEQSNRKMKSALINLKFLSIMEHTIQDMYSLACIRSHPEHHPKIHGQFKLLCSLTILHSHQYVQDGSLYMP